MVIAMDALILSYMHLKFGCHLVHRKCAGTITLECIDCVTRYCFLMESEKTFIP